MLAKKKIILGAASLYKLAAPRKAFYLVPFFSIEQTSFAPKNGWGMLVYAPGWSLASQF